MWFASYTATSITSFCRSAVDCCSTLKISNSSKTHSTVLVWIAVCFV